MKKHNVFISWSGDRSKPIAEAFFEWLPMVIQCAKPWVSSASIDKGSRGLVEIAKALDGIRVGVTFLTPENLKEPWILYEAGCLTKTVDQKTHLCTFLLGGLQNKDVEPPLGQFQHTQPEKEDTLHLVRTINRAVSDDEVIPEKTLEAIFERLWPDLEAKLKAFPSAPKGGAPRRSLEDMVAEILEFTRAETNRRTLYSFLAQPLGIAPVLSSPPAPPSDMLTFSASQEAARGHYLKIFDPKAEQDRDKS
jgi:hypothetical protein